jgi:catechol 2,3-dioxygenase-like lactoylglutathione lyase family enzyme
MPKYNFDHIHLVSANPVKAADFYIRMFGAKKVNESHSTNAIQPGIHIELTLAGTKLVIAPARANQLIEDTPRERRGLEHFGMFTNDINESVAGLKANGVKILDDPYMGMTGNIVAYLEGPDNVIIELKQAPK